MLRSDPRTSDGRMLLHPGPPQELIDALVNKRLTEGRRFIIQEMKRMVDSGLSDLESVSIVMPPSAFNPEPIDELAAGAEEVMEGNLDVEIAALELEPA